MSYSHQQLKIYRFYMLNVTHIYMLKLIINIGMWITYDGLSVQIVMWYQTWLAGTR